MAKYSVKKLVISLLDTEINNLYRPNSSLKSESLDTVHVVRGYSHSYAPVLLKEWFFLLRPGGKLTIEYEIVGDVTFQSIESMFWWLLRGKYEISLHTQLGKKGKITVTKQVSCFVPGDTISRWTFGIITNGDRDDWMNKIIESIHRQKIPEYEVIVCGKYKDRKEKNISYIAFNDRSERGWITKKKNLIGERAQYENLCILHDRLVLDDRWYEGMKRYGNAYELLGCVQVEKGSGEQAGDWLTYGGPIDTRYKVSRLDYSDWDYYVYLSGQLTIIKKSIWQEVLWDETRYWDGQEDADISFRSRDDGYIIRFNPYSKLTAFTWRHGKLPLKYSRKDGLLPKDMLFRRAARVSARLLFSFPFMGRLLLMSYAKLSKTKLYKHLIYH